MSSEIDQRIVEMRFENGQFENGVKNTLSTLEKLKSSLKFDNRADGFDAIQKSANSLNFNKLETALDSVIHRYSTLGIVGARVVENLVDKAMLGIQKVTDQLKTGGMNRALNLEQAKFQISGMNIEWDETLKSGISQNVNDAVSGTAYGLDAAAKAAAQLVASNVAVGDSMYEALRGISGVASMTSSTYEEIANVFTRIAGNGRVYAMDLQSLSSRGLNAAATLAQQLGYTEEQIRQFVSDGEINFEVFSKAMYSAFGEQAGKANETFTGALSNMKSAISRIGEKFATPLIQNVTPVMVSMIGLFNAVNKSLEPMIEGFKEFASVMSEKLITAIDAVKNSLVNADNTLNIETNFIVPIASGIQIIGETIEGVIDLFGKFWSAAFGDLDANPLIGFARWFENFASTLRYIFTGQEAEGISEFVAEMENGGGTVKYFQQTVEAFGETARILYDALTMVTQNIIVPLVTKLLPAALKHVSQLAKEIRTIVGFLFNNDLFEKATKGIGTIVSSITEFLFGIDDDTEKTVNKTLESVGKAITTVADKSEEKSKEATREAKKNLNELRSVAEAVIRGDYGNGDERIKKLLEAGYENYQEIQDLVNKILTNGFESTIPDATEESEESLDNLEKKYVEIEGLVERAYQTSRERVNSIFKSVDFEELSPDYMYDKFFDDMYNNLIDYGYSPEEATEKALEGAAKYYQETLKYTKETWESAAEDFKDEIEYEQKPTNDRLSRMEARTFGAKDVRELEFYTKEANQTYDDIAALITSMYKDVPFEEINPEAMTKDFREKFKKSLKQKGAPEEVAEYQAQVMAKLYSEKIANITEAEYIELMKNALDLDTAVEAYDPDPKKLNLYERAARAIGKALEFISDKGILLLDKVIKPAASFVKGVITGGFNKVVGAIKDIVEWTDKVFEYFSSGDILEKINSKVSKIKENVVAFVTPIWDKIRPFIEKIKGIKLPEFNVISAEDFSKAVSEGINWVLDKAILIQEKFGEAWNFVSEKAKAALSVINSFIVKDENGNVDIFETIKGAALTAFESIKTKIEELNDDFKSLFQTDENGNIDIFETIKKVGSDAFETVTKKLNEFKDGLLELPSKIGNFFRQLLGIDPKETTAVFREVDKETGRYLDPTIFESMGYALEDLYDKIRELPIVGDIAGFFEGIPEKVSEAIASFESFGGISWIFDSLSNSLKTFKDTVTSFFLNDDGEIDVIGTFADAIQTAFDALRNFSFSDLQFVKDAKNFLENEYKELTGFDNLGVQYENEEQLTGLGRALLTVYKWAESVKEAIGNAIEQGFNKLKEIKITLEEVPVIGSIITFFDGLGERIAKAFSGISFGNGEEGVTFFDDILSTVNQITSVIAGWFTELEKNVSEFPFIKAIIEGFEKAKEKVDEIFGNLFGNDENGAPEGITSAVDSVVAYSRAAGLTMHSGSMTLKTSDEIEKTGEAAQTSSGAFGLLTTAFKVLGTVIGAIVSGLKNIYTFLMAKLPEAVEKAKPVLEDIGVALSKFFSPIGEAIGGVFSNIYESIHNYARGTEEAVEGVNDISGAVSETAGNNSLAGEANQVTETVDILGSVVEHIGRFVDKLIEFYPKIKDVAWTGTWIAFIWSLKGIFDALSEVLAIGGGAGIINKIFGTIQTLGKNVLQIGQGIALIAGSAVVAVNVDDFDKIKEMFDKITFLLSIIIGGIVAFRIYAPKMALGPSLINIFDNIGVIIGAIGVGIAALTGSIIVLGKMPNSDVVNDGLKRLIGVIAALLGAFGGTEVVDGLVKVAGGAVSKWLGLGDFSISLQGVASTIFSLGVGVLALVAALKFVKGASKEDYENGIARVQEIITSLVGGLFGLFSARAIDVLAQGVATKIAGTITFGSILSDVGAAIGLLAAGVVGVIVGISHFASMDRGELEQGVTAMQDTLTMVVEAVTGVMEGISGVTVAVGLAKFLASGGSIEALESAVAASGSSVPPILLALLAIKTIRWMYSEIRDEFKMAQNNARALNAVTQEGLGMDFSTFFDDTLEDITKIASAEGLGDAESYVGKWLGEYSNAMIEADRFISVDEYWEQNPIFTLNEDLNKRLKEAISNYVNTKYETGNDTSVYEEAGKKDAEEAVNEAVTAYNKGASDVEVHAYTNTANAAEKTLELHTGQMTINADGTTNWEQNYNAGGESAETAYEAYETGYVDAVEGLINGDSNSFTEWLTNFSPDFSNIDWSNMDFAQISEMYEELFNFGNVDVASFENATQEDAQTLANIVHDKIYDAMKDAGYSDADAAQEAINQLQAYLDEYTQNGYTIDPAKWLMDVDVYKAKVLKYGEETAPAWSEGLGNGTETITEAAGGAVSVIFDELGNAVSGALGLGEDTSSNYAEGANGGKTLIENAFGILSEVPRSTFSGKITDYFNSGKHSVEAIISGVMSQQDELEYAASIIGNAFKTAYDASLVINSPSAAMEESGFFTIEGLLKGVSDRILEVKQSGVNTANAFYAGIQEAQQLAQQVLSNNFILDPTVRPVVDLSEIQNGAYQATQMFAGTSAQLASGAKFSFNQQQMAQIEANQSIPPVDYTPNFTGLSNDIKDLARTILESPLVLDTGAVAGGMRKYIDMNLGETSMRRIRGM